MFVCFLVVLDFFQVRNNMPFLVANTNLHTYFLRAGVDGIGVALDGIGHLLMLQMASIRPQAVPGAGLLVG